MKYLLNFQDIEFTSPIFLGVGLILTVLIAVFRLSVHKKNGISFTEVEFSMKPGFFRASLGIYAKTFFLAMITILVSVILAGPYTENFSGAIKVESVKKLRTSVVVLDISGSMRMKFDEDSDLKFNIVRDNLVNFLENVEDMRVSVIFFSDQPTPIRWFSSDTSALAGDISNLDIYYNEIYRNDIYERLGTSQLKVLSRGTNTPRALKLAGDMLSSLEMSDKELRNSASIILFTDLYDNFDEIIAVIKDFTSKGVRVYIISITNPSKLKDFKQRMAGNELVNIFNSQNEQDIEETFTAIAELEPSAVSVEETIQTQKTLAWEFAQFLFFVLLVFVLFSEAIFHNVRGGHK